MLQRTHHSGSKRVVRRLHSASPTRCCRVRTQLHAHSHAPHSQEEVTDTNPGCLGGTSGKESAHSAGDMGGMGSVPGSGRSPGEGNGKPL